MSTVVTRSLKPYDSDDGQTGIISPSSRGWVWNSIIAVANRAYATRFVPSRPMTITKIAFAVSIVANNDDSCDVGIYDAAGAKIVTSGATAGKLTATGVQSITITSTTLTPGTVYYAAFSCAVAGTAATMMMAGFGNTAASPNALFGATFPTVQGFLMDTAYVLPTALTVAITASNFVGLALREA